MSVEAGTKSRIFAQNPSGVLERKELIQSLLLSLSKMMQKFYHAFKKEIP
jgi:hypothetical protein